MKVIRGMDMASPTNIAKWVKINKLLSTVYLHNVTYPCQLIFSIEIISGNLIKSHNDYQDIVFNNITL